MEQENKKIPFPQANDFDKIYELICLEDESKLHNNDFLKQYLNLGTDRQIAYYVSACEFLGIITHAKEFSVLGQNIRNMNYDLRVLTVCKIIISLPVFGETFFMKYLYNEILCQDDIAQLITILYGIDNYEVCKRRASTVTKWLEWIEKNSKK